MPYKVTIKNSGESFTVENEETILVAAKRQKITLPYGCDNGVCGACVYKIIAGDVEYPAGQPFALLDEDIEAGKGLCCVGHPNSDMEIELEYPEEDFEPWF
jgi:ferredoxin